MIVLHAWACKGGTASLMQDAVVLSCHAVVSHLQTASRFLASMTTFCLSCCRLSSAAEGTSRHTAGSAAAAAQQQCCASDAAARAACAAAAPASQPAADDLRLMRPIDPTNPNYYWKPLPGIEGKAGGSAANTIDSILGAQVGGPMVCGQHQADGFNTTAGTDAVSRLHQWQVHA